MYTMFAWQSFKPFVLALFSTHNTSLPTWHRQPWVAAIRIMELACWCDWIIILLIITKWFITLWRHTIIPYGRSPIFQLYSHWCLNFSPILSDLLSNWNMFTVFDIIILLNLSSMLLILILVLYFYVWLNWLIVISNSRFFGFVSFKCSHFLLLSLIIFKLIYNMSVKIIIY